MTDTVNIVPIPKLGVAWIVNDYFTLKNNYFRSFKFPDFNDLYWVQSGLMGNPYLKNEDGWGADVSMEFTAPDLLNLNSTLYGQWINDSIHWSNMSGTWKPENSGEAVFIGLDNKIDFTFPFSPGMFEKPILSLSWVFQLSWLLNNNLTFQDNRRIPYMPMHTVGASLELPWKNGSFSISGHFESSRFTETGNIISLAPCFLLNIIYNQKLSKNIGVFGKINNALNSSYVSYADYPMPGINLALGMNMKFEGIGIQ
jgi:vitamin B12 transporter